MKPEDKAKNGVRDLLKKYKIWYFKPAMNGFGVAGIPDFCCVIQGRAVFIETKGVGKEPTPLQQAAIKGINLAGGVAIVVTENRLIALEKLLQLLLKQPELSGVQTGEGFE